MGIRLGGSVALLVVSAFALSGCIGTDDSTGSAGKGPRAPDAEPEFGADTGAIAGFVYNEESLPIVEATVGILNPVVQEKTDDEGRFALDNLAPGEYHVFATALGHDTVTQLVEVTAGEVASDVTFILPEVACAECPYHTTYIIKATLSGVMWKLTPTCIYTDINPLAKTCGGVRLDCEPEEACEVHSSTAYPDFTANWETIIGEVTWQGQTGATGKGFHFDLNAPNVTRGTGGSINQADPYTFKQSSNRAPMVVRIDKATLGDRGLKESDWNNDPKCNPASDNNCDWFWRLFPAAYDLGIGEGGFGPDYGVMYENSAEIYLSFFLNEVAPADFSALPEG